MTDATQRLIDAVQDVLPKVGQPENVWCMLHASTLREIVTALAAARQEAAAPEVRAAEPVTGTPGSVVWGVFQGVVQADGSIWFDAFNKSVEANTIEGVTND